jgi:transcriptional/translational regulatory protein YebC/TACO1
MKNTPVEKYVSENLIKEEIEKIVKSAYNQGFEQGCRKNISVIDSLREVLLEISLTCYANNLNRTNPEIREALNKLVGILEKTKYL